MVSKTETRISDFTGDLELWAMGAILVSSIVLIVFVFDRQLPTQFDDGVAPIIPHLAAGAIALLSSVTLIVRTRQILGQDNTNHTMTRADKNRRIAVFVVFIAYAILLPYLGYVISSGLVIFSLMILLGERNSYLLIGLTIIPPLLINLILARFLRIRFTELDNYFAGLF